MILTTADADRVRLGRFGRGGRLGLAAGHSPPPSPPQYDDEY